MRKGFARIRKEARTLFWPWCAVTAAGMLPSELSALAFLIGIPLLTVLSFGSEFQHGTLSLLLSQPERRLQIWQEKWIITLAAVLSAALVFYLGWQDELHGNPDLAVAGVVLLMAVGSGSYWTVLARSTTGGLALNLGAQLFVIAVWELLKTKFLGPRFTITAIDVSAALCYAMLMLWLGRRKLARFEVAGGVESQDLLTAGPALMPAALAGLFRCQPTGVIRNLIRKDLRLLRPLWLITGLFILAWTCLTITTWFGHGDAPLGAILASLLLGVFVPLALVLAGCLPVGEERSLGAHTWQRTLPVSARRQWFIKLMAAMSTGLVCAVLVPLTMIMGSRVLIGSSLGSNVIAELTSPASVLAPHTTMNFLLLLGVLCFSAFWCSCAGNGTGTAAIWVLPALGVLCLAAEWGGRVFGYTGPGIARVQMGVSWLIAPVLLLATIQSYGLFHAQDRPMLSLMARRLLPLAAATFLCSFLLEAVRSWRSLPG